MALFKSNKGDQRAYFVGLLVCLGGFLFGYDTGVVGGTLTLRSYQESFGYADHGHAETVQVEALAVGLQQCGSFVGCFLVFPLTARFGRRLAMQVSSLVFVIGAIAQTVVTNHLASFYVGRIVAGLGVGGASVLVPLYASEMSPKHLRGSIGSGYQFLFTWGIFCSYWANYGVDQHVSPDLNMQWQIPISMQIIPGGLLGFGMFLVPESARWLAAHDRMEEAWKALTWIRASEGTEVQQEMEEIRTTVAAEKQIKIESQGKSPLRNKVTIYRILLSFTVMVCQVCTGANAIAYFSPQFFNLVTGSPDDSLLISGIFGAIKIISCGVFVFFLSERVGRRFAFCGGALFMSACLICVAVLIRVAPPDGNGVSSSGIAVVALIYLAIIAYNVSWGPLGWIYIAEVLSPSTRDLGVAVALGTQWIFNIIWSVATPYMIVNIGWATFLFFGVIDIFSAVFSWFFVKETMGKSLEEMEQAFHSKAGEITEAQAHSERDLKDGMILSDHVEKA